MQTQGLLAVQITWRCLINPGIRTQNGLLIFDVTKIQCFHSDSISPGPILLQWLRRQRSKNVAGPTHQQPNFPPSASYQHRAGSSPADLAARVRRRTATAGSLHPAPTALLPFHSPLPGRCLPARSLGQKGRATSAAQRAFVLML